jgi:predicted transcriptional regulator
MYIAYIMHRTQIYLGEDQNRLLEERAGSLGTTKSAVIRDAIDAFLARGEMEASGVARLRAAVVAATGVADHLPSGAVYVDEVRALDSERDRQLDAARSR